jgi:hypothetical protein
MLRQIQAHLATAVADELSLVDAELRNEDR